MQHNVHRRHTDLTQQNEDGVIQQMHHPDAPEESEDSVIQQMHYLDSPERIDPVEAAIIGEVQQAQIFYEMSNISL